MNPSERERLLREILATDFRAESLTAGLDYLRRRRRRARLANFALAAAAPLALIAWLLHLMPAATRIPSAARTSGAASPNSDEVKIISDEELFAHFPGRAMALIGPRGHQQLVFLDEPSSTESPSNHSNE